MKLQNALAELSDLQVENNVLKKQLGFIPERKKLLAVEIISSTEKEYYLSFPYEKLTNLVDKEIIYENQYLGKIIRQGSNVLVAKKPVASDFVAKGQTETQAQGWIKGEYNDLLYLETTWEEKIHQGDLVYLVSQENSFLYLLGKINQIKTNERQSLRRGYIDYLPQKLNLKYCFIVL
jgi:hypothetical protein